MRSSTDFIYANKTNYLTGVKHFSPLGTQNIGYTYGDVNQGQMPDQVYEVSWNGAEKLNYAYDPLGRLTSKTILVGGGVSDAPHTLDTQYTYFDVGTDKTTTLLKSLQTPAGTYNYTYDAVGNITSVQSVDDRYHYSFDYTSSFAYDDLNQLVRENNPQLGKTYTYSYVNGNITERKEYAYTTGELGEVLDTRTWSYTDGSWRDLLTSYNGISISYDEIGNPTEIDSQSLTWNGRQLQQIVDGENTYSYAYNTDGQRVSKTVNGVTTEYFYNDNILAGQKTGDKTLVFMYDNNGDPFGFTYDGTTFHYVKNAQNDVVGLECGGNVVAYYFYDAWGNTRIINDAGYAIYDQGHPAYINPIRYRSYYYDHETNLYFLNSRYYSPDICRFLNADVVTDGGAGLVGANLFAYGANNPVNNSDQSGNWIIKNTIKWVAEYVAKPIVKAVQNKLSKINATYSRGVNISGSPSAFSFNLQAGISMDTKGNVAVQANFSGGVTSGSPSVSVSRYQTRTNAPNIKKLNGLGAQMGGSVGIPAGVPLYVGGDFNIIPDEELDKVYFGITKNIGFGTPGAEGHVEWGESATFEATYFNVFDVAKGIYVKIMEW